MFRLSNNTELPEASALGVKSFWLLLVTVLVTACNAIGFALLPSLCEVGLGCTAEEVVARGEHAVSLIQQLVPIGTAIWLWFERRAPNFRLVFWRKPSAEDLHLGPRSLILLMGAAMLLLGSAPQAMAAQCLPVEQVNDLMRKSWGELPAARALAGDDQVPTLLYTNPESGSWTLIVLQEAQACLILSGSGWEAIPDGEPA